MKTQFNNLISTKQIALGALVLALNAIVQVTPDPDQRAEALLAQMTLDEKIGQMVQADMNALHDKGDVQKYFLGSVLSGGGSDPADMTAAGWAKIVEEFKSLALQTRLKIPLLYRIDAVHGNNNVLGAGIFPHNIGLGATRDVRLVERAAHITALETRAIGAQWAFAPCLAVAQDARWGRTYESFGESPELAVRLGAAAVRGLQGKTLSDPTSVLACAKHFAGDGGTQDGKNEGNTVCDEATLRRLHLAPYPAAKRAAPAARPRPRESARAISLRLWAELLNCLRTHPTMTKLGKTIILPPGNS